MRNAQNVLDISIHAPTRGATNWDWIQKARLIFQSTLLQEERRTGKQKARKTKYFNPRSYKRSDKRQNPKMKLREKISIHAPTRGATMPCLQRERRKMRFQSTLLQEERPNSEHIFDFVSDNFNPRSYKRSDSKNAQYSLCISAIIIA